MVLGIGTRNQTATLWRQTAANGFGERGYSAPALIVVRWQDENQLKLARGQEMIDCVAQVMVNDNLAITVGDYIALGDKSGTADPKAEANAYWVFDIVNVPTVLGDGNTQKVLLTPK